MNGIILKTDTKTNLTVDEVTQGALGLTSDTDELVVNDSGELKYRDAKISSTNAVSKNAGTPVGGDNGDLVLDTNAGQHREYYKMNSWKARFEGYSQTYLEANFEPNVTIPNPQDLIRVDGTVPMDGNYGYSTPDSIITKQFVDLLATGDVSEAIKTDGSRQMDVTYSPISTTDVIDKKYLSSGEMVIIPPTVQPGIVGAIWNDLGVLKIDDGSIYYWEINGNPYRFQMDPINGRMLDSLYQATYAEILNPDGTSFGQLTGGTSWTISNNPRSRSIYGDFAIIQKNTDTIDLYNISTLAGRQTPINSVTSPGIDPQFFSSGSIDIGVNGFIVGDEKGTIDDTGEVFVYDLNGNLEFSLISPHAPDGSGGTYPGSFGVSTAISENYIVVGDVSPYEIATDSSSGQAYLYHRNGTFIKTIKSPMAPDVGWFNYFGDCVMISEPNNMFVVVGHQCGDDHQGSAYLYDLAGTLIKELVIADRSTLDGDLGWYGYNAHINDTTGIISLGTGSGEVIIFDKFGDLILHNKSDVGYYGSSIGSYGNKLFVGALNYSLDASHNGPIIVTTLPN